MRLLALTALAVAYGLLFHVLMRLCVVLFGPVPPESAVAFPVRDVVYLGASSLLAGAAVTYAWMWRFKSFPLGNALAVGTISILLILANLMWSRGFGGPADMFTTRPVHASASFALAFVAVPLCAFVVGSMRRARAAQQRMGAG